MKLTTFLLTLVLAFGTVLPAQNTKDEAKKKVAESKQAAADTKATAKKAAAKQKQTAVADNERCTATTQDGDRCKRKAQDGSKLCWQHAGMQKKGAAKAKKS